MRVIPRQVTIETINKCNLACKYCPTLTNKGKFPVGEMDFDFFCSIVDRINWDTIMVPWINGEIMLHPRYAEMCAYMNQKKVKYNLTTNLTLWRPDVLKQIFSPESSCNQLIVSVDGCFGTGNIPKSRPGTDEDLLKENLRRLLSWDRGNVQLGVKICKRGMDWGEIERYVKQWVETVDFVCVGEIFGEPNPVSMRTEPCQFPGGGFMVVRWDGSLVICTYNDRAVNGLELSYGKLNKTDDLIDVYNNALITDLREKQNRGEYPGPCELCSHAYTGVGSKGIVEFRDMPGQKLFYHRDYGNIFYSLKDRSKTNEWYGGRN